MSPKKIARIIDSNPSTPIKLKEKEYFLEESDPYASPTATRSHKKVMTVSPISKEISRSKMGKSIDKNSNIDFSQEKDVSTSLDDEKCLSTVDRVYKLIRKTTGALGGNGYNAPIYGEITMHSMQKVIDVLVEKCELGSDSRFIDVGAGLGKPNFHISQFPKVRLSIGVEIAEIRWQLSMLNLSKYLDEKLKDLKNDKVEYNGGINFIVSDIDIALTMDPFTHIYMYDLGFPPPLQQSIAKKFNNSVHARYLVSYRPPQRVIEVYGYNVELVARVPTSMHGSGEVHTAYLYKRLNINPLEKTSINQRKLLIPARIEKNSFNFKEKDVEVFCDEAFFPASKQAIGKDLELKAYADNVVNEFTSGERPKRERKPRKLYDGSN